MKKIFLILVLSLCALNSLKAQEKDGQMFDTVIFYPPLVMNCPFWWDSVGLFDTVDPSSNYYDFHYYHLLRITCRPDLPLLSSILSVIGSQDTLYTKNKAFSQPYHLDSAVRVIGVAAKVNGSGGFGAYANYFKLMDTSRTVLARAQVPFSVPINQQNIPFWRRPIGKFYFSPNLNITIKDFFITVDNDITGSYRFDHTVSFTEDSCLKIDKGCTQYGYPYLQKLNGQWLRFDQDTVYQFYRKMHIGWFPILLIPKNNSLNDDINIENTCNILPNPAKDKLKLMSQFKVKDIEIYNILGIKVRTIQINDYEKTIDISNLKSGAYVVHINTIRGIVKKKLIKE